MRPHRIFVSILLSLASGCSREEPAQIQADAKSKVALSGAPLTPRLHLNDDPALHFKKFLSRFLDAVKEKGKYDFVLNEFQGKEWFPPKYDVRKTDSLVSPFLATFELSFKVEAPHEKPREGHLSIRPAFWLTTFEFTSPAQDGQWTFQEPKFSHTYFHENYEPGGKRKPSDDDRAIAPHMPQTNKVFREAWESAAAQERPAAK